METKPRDYWLVLLVLVARGVIGMNEQGRYVAHAERYEKAMATLGDSHRRQDGRWVAHYEASIGGSRRRLRWESSLEPTPEANLWYEPGTAHGWVEGNAYDPAVCRAGLIPKISLGRRLKAALPPKLAP